MSERPPEGLNQLEQMMWAYPWMRPTLAESARRRRAAREEREREAARRRAELERTKRDREQWERAERERLQQQRDREQWERAKRDAHLQRSQTQARQRERVRQKQAQQREQAPLYLRFGDIPASGRSSTLRRAALQTRPRAALTSLMPEEEQEGGVSCFRARFSEGVGYEVLCDSVALAIVFHMFGKLERPAYLIEGKEVGLGCIGEPLLHPPNHRRLEPLSHSLSYAPPVGGSVIEPTLEILFAGSSARLACSLIIASSGAMYTQ